MGDPHKASVIDRPSVILAGLVVSAIGALFYNVLPLALGVAQDARDLSDQAVGLLGSAFFVGFTITTISAFFWIRICSWRSVTAIAVVIAVAALLLMAAADGYAATLAATAIAGGAFSAVYAVGTTLLGDTSKPARWYGAKIAAEAAVGAAMLLLLPKLVSIWGFTGLVGGIAGAAVLLSLLAWGMPKYGAAAPVDELQSTTLKTSPSVAIWFALLGVLTFMAAGTMAWAFLERLANDAGYSTLAIGNVLSASLVFAVLGSLVAAVVESRFGLSRPMVFACLCLAVAATLLAQSSSLTAYAAGAFALTFAFGMGIPYTVTIAANLDSDGRYVVLTVPAIGLANIVAPATAGLIAASSGYGGVMYVGGATSLVALALVLLALRVGDRMTETAATGESG